MVHRSIRKLPLHRPHQMERSRSNTCRHDWQQMSRMQERPTYSPCYCPSEPVSVSSLRRRTLAVGERLDRDARNANDVELTPQTGVRSETH